MKCILFTKNGWEEYAYWLQQDVKYAKKINVLLRSIMQDGVLLGEGKPEKLKYRPGDYSRRIDSEHRLVYSIDGDCIVVKSCQGHYED